MDISKKVVLFLSVILLLINPNFAIEDFRNVDYITPKLGASVSGQYYYTNDYVDWYWATPSFESNEGYYNIYEVGDTINFQITVNSTKSGTLSLRVYYQDETGDVKTTDYEVWDLANYPNLRVSQEVTLTNTMYGNTLYVWVLTSGGTEYHSQYHTFYIRKNLNTNWKYRRSIDISSTEKLKDGIAQITINDSDFYDSATIGYEEDDATHNYAGTTTDLVFTNTDQTKAYPYFINKYKGGYYNYSRETSNDTLIDLWINEDLNNIAVYLYYDFQLLGAGSYLYGNIWLVGDRLDNPNNPFTVHQVFSDYRWTETMFTDLFNKIGSLSYYRGEYLETSWTSTAKINFFYNNLTTFNFKTYFRESQYYESRINFKSYNSTNYLFKGKSGLSVYYSYLYNSTQHSINVGSPSVITINKIYYDSNYLFFEREDSTIINISENIFNCFNLFEIELYGSIPDYAGKLYWYKEFADNAITYTIGNQSLTTYAIIQFNSMYEYDTFINDLWLGGIVTTDSDGLFLCKDMNGSVLGSIEIDTNALNGFEITLPYTITNKTDFLNRSDFNYSCKFITDDGFSEESDNLTITFESNRIYLSDILPTTQQNISSQYVGFKINSEQNYTGIDTDFYHYIWKVQCNTLNDNGECLEYDPLSMNFNFSATNISKSYEYYEVEKLDKSNWYVVTYKYCKSSNCSSTATRLFYIYEEIETYFPPEEYLDWNDTNVTDNEDFMNEMFWDNPLYYLSSFLYQDFIIPNIEGTAQTVFLYVFTIFWNFLFILLLIAIAVYMKVDNLPLSLGVTLAGALLFGYLGWISISATTLLVLVIAGVGLYLKKSAG